MALAINLPRHIREYIDRQIAEGHHASEEDVIVSVFEQVIDDERATDDPELAASIAEAERGEVQDLTLELKADIRRQVATNLQRGHRVRDDITY